MKLLIRQCVNRNCNNVFYVEKHKAHECLQCKECINKNK